MKCTILVRSFRHLWPSNEPDIASNFAGCMFALNNNCYIHTIIIRRKSENRQQQKRQNPNQTAKTFPFVRGVTR